MTSTATKIFNLRLPPDLRDWLELEARRNLRSLNKEIIFKLMESREFERKERARIAGDRPV